jgi:hypothetical protein
VLELDEAQLQKFKIIKNISSRILWHSDDSTLYISICIVRLLT